MSSTDNTLDLKVADARAKEDNTSLISFFASLMARITYEPPIIYQLGLIEIMKILKNTKDGSGNNMLKLLDEFIGDVNKASGQTEFIKLIGNQSKMVSLSGVAKKINDRLYELETAIYKEEGMPKPKIGEGVAVDEPKSFLEANAMPTPAPSQPAPAPAAPPPAAPPPAASQHGGSKNYMDINLLSEQFREEFKNAANGDIKTVYLQTNHDENVYITAFKSINTITVTFRGTGSIKNTLSDLHAKFNKSCIKLGEDKGDKAQEGGFIKFLKKKPTEIKDLGGMLTMLDSTMKTLMYSLVYLSKTFLKLNPKNEKLPANIYAFGHSLGGGLSTIFAYEYIGAHNKLTADEKKSLSPKITCISNAAPRVLNEAAKNGFMDYVKNGKIKYLRQWTAKDFVPAIPPERTGYFHPKDKDVTTTLKLAQTYDVTLPHRVNYSKSLKGEIDAETGTTLPSIYAHCFQTYINYWPVAKRFSLGADKDTHKADEVHRDSDSSKSINIKFVTMGNDGFKSRVLQVSESPIGPNLSSNIDSGVKDYKWFVKNVIEKLNLGNQSLPEEPEKPEAPTTEGDKDAEQLNAVAKNLANFATESCREQEEQEEKQQTQPTQPTKTGGKKTKKHRVNKKHKTKKHRVNKKYKKTKKHRVHKKYKKSKKK